MKSNPNDKKCQECYKRVRKTGTLLFCEATGFCKHRRAKE